MEQFGKYTAWRKNIKMMWNSPAQSGEKLNDGMLECWKKEMMEYWNDMKNSASEIVNTIRLENELMLLNTLTYVWETVPMVKNNQKAGEC